MVARAASRRAALAVHRIMLLLVVARTLAGWSSPRGPGVDTVARLLRGDWPWQIGALDESSPGQDTTRIVLTVIAGLGAAVAPVVACRRQRNAELVRFDRARCRCAARRRPRPHGQGIAMAALATPWTSNGNSASTTCAPTCGCPPTRTRGYSTRSPSHLRCQRTATGRRGNTHLPTPAQQLGPAHHQQHIAGHLDATAALVVPPVSSPGVCVLKAVLGLPVGVRSG